MACCMCGPATMRSTVDNSMICLTNGRGSFIVDRIMLFQQRRPLLQIMGRINFTSPETLGIVPPDAENCMIVSSFFWTKHRNMTGRIDRRTNRQVIAITVVCSGLTPWFAEGLSWLKEHMFCHFQIYSVIRCIFYCKIHAKICWNIGKSHRGVPFSCSPFIRGTFNKFQDCSSYEAPSEYWISKLTRSCSLTSVHHLPGFILWRHTVTSVLCRCKQWRLMFSKSRE